MSSDIMAFDKIERLINRSGVMDIMAYSSQYPGATFVPSPDCDVSALCFLADPKTSVQAINDACPYATQNVSLRHLNRFRLLNECFDDVPPTCGSCGHSLLIQKGFAQCTNVRCRGFLAGRLAHFLSPSGVGIHETMFGPRKSLDFINHHPEFKSLDQIFDTIPFRTLNHTVLNPHDIAFICHAVDWYIRTIVGDSDVYVYSKAIVNLIKALSIPGMTDSDVTVFVTHCIRFDHEPLPSLCDIISDYAHGPRFGMSEDRAYQVSYNAAHCLNELSHISSIIESRK